ncbi:cysteine desulfurase [Emcibacter nanhaiensis]|uniref:Cysteine desulfurase n=1 Tax=Emcibacter nanhaiensis TaxID=1505037 RepID=A0A501PSM5_9PROT|nr:cysteine desulfurase [Emcibacter nanhaiensis]
MAYLDYNATVPVRPEVIEEMSRALAAGGNASSVHTIGRKAKATLEKSRATIADMINCRPQMITFTSGGTEANNIALRCVGAERLIVAATEHDSVLDVARHFPGETDILPVSERGLIDRAELENLLKNSDRKTVVSIMLANNETGVIQEIAELSELVHYYNALMHTDAVQAFGKIPLDFRALGVDMMSLSSHKIGGPQGAGAFVAWEKIDVEPLIRGGGQELGRRSGTENLPGIAGFGTAAGMVPKSLQAMQQIGEWRDRIEQQLSRHSNKVRFFGAASDRLPNVTSILMPDVSSETQVMAMDLEGICVSAGSACSSGKVKASHVITAMGGSEQEASSTIRVSLGWNSKQEDVERFITAWCKLYDRKHGA